jgi:hypothetical protein
VGVLVGVSLNFFLWLLVAVVGRFGFLSPVASVAGPANFWRSTADFESMGRG